MPLLLFTCKIHCLQIFKHIKCILQHQSVGVCEVSDMYLLGCWRHARDKNMQNKCGCVLLFKNMQFSCKHCGDGVSTWEKFDGHI